MTVDTKEIVTTIGYMIGVKKNILEQCFGERVSRTFADFVRQ